MMTTNRVPDLLVLYSDNSNLDVEKCHLGSELVCQPTSRQSSDHSSNLKKMINVDLGTFTWPKLWGLEY